MSRTQFDEFLRGLTVKERAALFNTKNFHAVRDLAHRLATTAGSIFIRKLDFTDGAGLIGRLVQKGGFCNCTSSEINDRNYPITGTGIVEVRFRTLKGEDLKRADGFVYRTDVEARFRTDRMRCPNAAEALLVPAEDKKIGRGDNPLVAFISGSNDVFFVDEDAGERDFNRYSDGGSWDAHCEFLGVYE